MLTSKDEDADLKLADFGFAVYAEGDTLTEQLGTPDYMAPEILSRIPYGSYGFKKNFQYLLLDFQSIYHNQFNRQGCGYVVLGNSGVHTIR